MSINKKTAIITFDYEVFLGRKTGTVENCVIKPAKLILETLRANNAKAIFFVDTAWLLFLKENFYPDFQNITRQLKEIISSGSSVELHLHPQWLKAFKSGDEIGFGSFDNYKLSSLSKYEIHDLFKKSIDLLESITYQKVTCFRAGGFCIEPFSQIKDVFAASGIRYDFSVVPGLFLREGKVYDFDFSRAPELPFYKFTDNIMDPDKNGLFVEVPLSTFNNNPLYRIVNKLIMKLYRDKMYGDGIGIQEKAFLSARSIKGWLKFTKGMLTLDNTSNLFFKYILNVHLFRPDLLVFISHPKTFSPKAIENLRFVTTKYKTLSSVDLEKYLTK